MVISIPEGMEIPYQIMKLELEIEKISKWKIIQRYKLRKRLDGLRVLAFYYGFVKAMEDLEKAGIVKRVN